MEAQLADGTAQGRRKRIIGVVLRLLESAGGRAGRDGGEYEALEYRTGRDPVDRPPSLFSGDYELNWPHGYETDGEITIIQDYPLPFTLLAIIPNLYCGA